MVRQWIRSACFISGILLAFVGPADSSVLAAMSPYDGYIETLSRHYGVEPTRVKAIIKNAGERRVI